MPENEFNRFVEQAQKLRTKRKRNGLSLAEADLIHQINTTYSAEKRRRYTELYEKFQQDKITPKEHRELLKLNGEFEMLNAKRLEYFGKLAEMRGQSLKEVIKDFGIKS